MISLIAAFDKNGLIGIDDHMPWYAPADMQNFRRLTTGHTVVMGRTTYDSIGKPLKDRVNIVLTRKKQGYCEGVNYYNSIESFLYTSYYPCYKYKPDKNVFVIGGSEVYRGFAPYVERMYITVIDQFIKIPSGAAATFFPWPAFFNTQWRCAEQKMLGPNFYFVYDRVNYASKTQKDSKCSNQGCNESTGRGKI